ncbi:MAG: thymidine phosphorylase [Bacteroidetes bacterium]|nr:thymidine phosphorylase [Bacteroidota bacterium]
MLDPVALLARKRDGHALAPGDIRALVDAYTDGTVPDYQMAAFLMAGFLQGFSDEETDALVDAMLHSGEVLRLDEVPGKKVDKHSTGGVGDKVSLLLAPMVAACGVPVPMISGRGLGHTGGTLDKLESIPGFNVNLTVDEYRQNLADHGVVMLGQTAEVAPADRKIYALRDVTATVEFIPYIAASIMSKKLAAGLDALVLDVKTGKGAFMKAEADARRLAETLAGIGNRSGTPTVAYLTRMDAPLGRAAGNWPEIAETVRCLRGDTDGAEDLMAVTMALCAEMLVLGDKAADLDDARAQLADALDSGRAYAKFVEMVEAQGGDASTLDDPDARDGYKPAATVEADTDGFVVGLDALTIGHLTVAMGAGRKVKEDAVDPVAGVVMHAKPGDYVEKGQPLATLYTRRHDRLDEFRDAVRSAYTFGDAAPVLLPVVIDRYDATGWTGLR